jgi:hypothetical protein
MEVVMAKWSGKYLYDCHLMLKKIEKELAKIVDRGEPCHAYEEMEYGEYSVAIRLQNKIKQWRKEMFNEG